jgi:hypothetical protein
MSLSKAGSFVNSLQEGYFAYPTLNHYSYARSAAIAA